ncbi:MAG TPA: hypothetical protein PJ988_23485, partial [Anaerolinea sp.]|nr:hypothetical protein [Anaerolinea sp.]
MNEKRIPRSRKNGELAFIVVVVASFVVMFTSGATAFRIDGRAILALALGAIYTVIGIFGSRVVEARHTAWLTALYFLVELPLGAAIIYVSQANAWLIL